MQLINVALVYEFIPILVGALNIRDSLPDALTEKLIWFDNLNEVKAFLVEKSIPIYAIEITTDSKSVLEFHFPEAVALMPGNEGSGLNEIQRRIADGFIYIPHYGVGTASLNVHVATSIILYHFSEK